MARALTRTGARSIGSVVVVGCLLAACSSGSSHSPATPTTRASTAPTTTAATTGGPVSSSGCGRPLSPGTSTTTISQLGRTRSFIVHIPTGYTTSRAVPLILNLHGSASNAAQQEALSGMNATADAHTFVVVYPQAVIPSGAGFVWNIPGVPLIGGASVPAGAADDGLFLERVVSTMFSRACIDKHRVYATGLSGGARMSSQLGCDASTTFAAIAPVSGLRLPAHCFSPRAVPVVSFHGKLDPVDPYNGHGQAYWTYSVQSAAQQWAAHDSCAPAPQTSQPAPGVTLTTYGGCKNRAEVQLYTLAAEGHEWPGGPALPRAVTRVLGPQSDAVDANTVMWKFFMQHPMRDPVEEKR